MSLWERIESAMIQGIDSSKTVLGKAKERAKDLSERGVLKFDVMQLERQSMRLMSKLGNEVYEAFQKHGKQSVSQGTAGIKELVAELAELERRISEKDEALKQLTD
jgi:hypothetical protein